MTGIGHNGGPTLDAGRGWRRHCWEAARAELLPILPIEVVRSRVRRAKELGLDYKTYAGVRATTGHDIVAFLFSSNALRLRHPDPALPADRAEKLGQIGRCAKVALVQAPLAPDAVLAVAPAIDRAHPAPWPLASDGAVRGTVRAALGTMPAYAVLLVGDYDLERTWCRAARLGSYLPADRYFGSAQSLRG